MKDKFVKNHIRELKKCIDNLDFWKMEKIVDILYESIRGGRKVFLMGNGGSAATVSHFICDLNKNIANKRLKVISLNENIPLITAISNDVGYKNVFKKQLANLLEKDDIVIVFSASGDSKNIISALEYAKKNKAITIGFTGFKGGSLLKIVDHYLLVPSNDYGIIEDLHLILEHLIVISLWKKIKNG
ncbi:MAG: SIS domain-containing protein [Candidatus Omnitrophota bacterium]|nr:SIS domain-containing protein [Candidatus Omnitrophota bacterium]